MGYMKFSKERFLQNAEPGIKRQLTDHLNVLDGMKVFFPGEYKYGFIKQYFANGQEYHLYPIYKEWCQNEELKETFVQMNITDFIK